METPPDPVAPRETDGRASQGGFFLRLAVVVLVVTVAGILYWQFGQWLSLERLAQHEKQLLDFRDHYWWWVVAAAFLVYVAVTGASLPGAAVLSVVLAWFLGFWPALCLVSFASTAGATLAFLLSRFLFRDYVERRFGPRLKAFDDNLAREGAFYLFTLRLIPTVPFFVINLVMGPTRINVGTFWWVSQLGMLPGTIAFVWAGAAAPSLQELSEQGLGSILTWPLITAFVVLGTLPLLIRRAVLWLRSRSGDSRPEPNQPTR